MMQTFGTDSVTEFFAPPQKSSKVQAICFDLFTGPYILVFILL